MRFNKLDLNLLVALDMLLVECNITRAAERMHMSQSAMSSALARLREYFEDELLVPVGRKMELTPRAETLREAVRDVLLRIDTSLAAQPRFECTESDREFKLLVSDYSSTVLMPRVLALAQERRSTARFKLMSQFDAPARLLERGEADVLLVPKAFCSPEHPADIVMVDEFVCVVWEGSRHARDGLDFDRYASAGHVVMKPGEGNPPAFESWFVERFGLSRRIEVTCPSFAPLPFLVIGTELVATVHAKLARRIQGAAPVRLLRLPMPMPPIEQGLQWHKYRSNDPGLVWLRSLLHEAAADLDKTLPELKLWRPGS